MKRTPLLFATLILAAPVTAPAQSAVAIADSARRAIEAAQYTGDSTSLDSTRAYLRRALRQYPRDALLLHYAGYAAYRRLNLFPASEAGTRLPTMLVQTRALLEQSIKLKPMPESYAVLASIISRQIEHDPKKSADHILDAQAATMAGLNMDDSRNPRAWLMNGIAAFYTMQAHGGGFVPAEKLLRRAISFFEKENVSSPYPSWGHAEAYCWLGQALDKQGRTAEALAAYRKALELEPTYGWVKWVFIPEIEKRAAVGQGR